MLNFLDSPLFKLPTRVQAKTALDNRISPLYEDRLVFCELLDPTSKVATKMKDPNYFDLRLKEIEGASKYEADTIDNWYRRMEYSEEARRLEPSYDPKEDFDIKEMMRGKIGISNCHGRIYRLWFDAFNKQMPSLKLEMQNRVNQITAKLSKMTAKGTDEELVKRSRKLLYEPYRTKFSEKFEFIMMSQHIQAHTDTDTDTRSRLDLPNHPSSAVHRLLT